MKKVLIAFAALAAANGVAHAATIEVGPGKKYTTLAAAAYATRDYDTVIIYPGTYTSGAVWRANNITIRIPTGYARGSAIVSGGTVNGKGLFVTTGANIIVDGIRFQNAKVTDQNGAGIRAEGQNLTVRNCEFLSNEMGMLITPGTRRGTVTVANSLFRGNGVVSSYHVGHGVYANDLDKLVVTGSTFDGNKIGHHVKSRAYVTQVSGNTIQDSSYGYSSYLIDVPNGGALTVQNNRFVKGAYTNNGCCGIAIGFEYAKNPAGPIVVSGNSFTNQRSSSTSFVYNKTTTKAQLSSNTFSGVVTQLTQPNAR